MKVYWIALLILFSAVQTAKAAGIDSGEAAYERCALCHGLFGNTPRAKFPKLAGQNPTYLDQQIRDFLSGRRHNDGGQMSSIVTEITEEEITVVVEWFASQDDPEPVGAGSDMGKELFVGSGCESCHVEQRSDTEVVPLLSAQHTDYLIKQMRDLRDGTRSGGETGVMRQQLSRLNDNDIVAIAEYLAARERR